MGSAGVWHHTRVIEIPIVPTVLLARVGIAWFRGACTLAPVCRHTLPHFLRSFRRHVLCHLRGPIPHPEATIHAIEGPHVVLCYFLHFRCVIHHGVPTLPHMVWRRSRRLLKILHALGHSVHFVWNRGSHHFHKNICHAVSSGNQLVTQEARALALPHVNHLLHHRPYAQYTEDHGWW